MVVYYCAEMFFSCFTCSRGGLNHGIIHVNSRFRRDVRTMEEEEENWFDQEDENGEDTAMVEQNDLLNDDSVFKNRKSFVNEKSPPSIVNNKRVSISAFVSSSAVAKNCFQFFVSIGLHRKK